MSLRGLGFALLAAWQISAGAQSTDGGIWHTVGGIGDGCSGRILAAAVDAAANLYVGGETFAACGDVSASNIARWDGSAWHALDSGISGIIGTVRAIAVSGNDVYVVGNFARAGSVDASNVARWDGSTWHALGSGITGTPGISEVDAVAVSGNDVYVAGTFTSAGGIAVNNVAHWDGSAWHALGTGIQNPPFGNPVAAAIALSGTDVYAGGSDLSTGNGFVQHWTEATQSWTEISGLAFNTRINALAVQNGHVYAAGKFTHIGAIDASNIAMWDGAQWSTLAGALQTKLKQWRYQRTYFMSVAATPSDI